MTLLADGSVFYKVFLDGPGANDTGIESTNQDFEIGDETYHYEVVLAADGDFSRGHAIRTTYTLVRRLETHKGDVIGLFMTGGKVF